MTTIAYKDGIVACDSFYTSGGIVTDHNAKKRKDVNGVMFFMSGAVSDEIILIDTYFGDQLPSGPLSCHALVVDKDNLYEVGIHEHEGFWKSPLDWNNHYALGSGGNFALSAMDMGADARKAVKMGIYRDIYSGGKIKEYKVK